MVDCNLLQGFINFAKTSRILLVILLMLPGFAHAAKAEPGSVAFWYAPKPPLAELAQFDWVVFEPAQMTPEDVRFIAAQGSQPFAYLSIGELDNYQAQRNPGLLENAGSSVRNESWNSQVMDLASSRWREYIFNQAAEFSRLGYTGLFLDTLDSFMLLPEAERLVQREALLALIRDLHQRFPQLKLFFNRGFEILPDLDRGIAAVAVESIHAGWDAQRRVYRAVPAEDREWLAGQLHPLRERGIPVVAIDYLPPDRRDEARGLARTLMSEGYVPFISTPEFDYLGMGSLEVQPRRIALLFDPSQGDLANNIGFRSLGGLLEYMGYRVDYLPVDGNLPDGQAAGLYAGAVIWMANGAPSRRKNFTDWIGKRLDEGIPLAFFDGLPIESAATLDRMGLSRTGNQPIADVKVVEHDAQLLGTFEAPLVARSRGLAQVGVQPGVEGAALVLIDERGREHTPVVIGDWGGIALAPYVFEGDGDSRRWIINPFVFLQRALKLPPLPAPDATTENGRRIATVHIDGDGFPSRAEVPGTPYSGQQVMDGFIKPYPLLTSVSFIEGETGPKGMYPYLSPELEPIARRILAHERVEPATHTFSHPFFWQPDKEARREGFRADFGMKMPIPGYDTIDFRREIIGSRDYINSRLAPSDKPVRMIFWSGDANPDAATIKLAYEAGLLNVNGGVTRMTNSDPSVTGLYPLLRPTDGGLHVYAPIINENVYTNLWQGPYYGFRDVIDTFLLTETPRRLRGLHLYYHFYSGTKPAAIKVMGDIYAHMLKQEPISLWMSEYLRRVQGLHTATLARTTDGAWQVRALQGLRTLRLDPALGWPDLLASDGVAGVQDLPQGRYVHLSSDRVRLALQPRRDTAPALEQANVPLTGWRYLDEQRVELSFAGEFPIAFSVRHSGRCHLELDDQRVSGLASGGLWHFSLSVKQVRDAQLVCR